MLQHFSAYERMADTFGPLIVMAAVLTLQGRGFETTAPIWSCVIFSCIQPFIRAFIYDKVRGPLIRQGWHVRLLAASAVMYTALALLVSNWV
jgi:hypothetical protein